MVDNKDNTSLPPSEKEELGKLTRRDFIAGTTIALTGLATTGAALSPLLDAQETPSVDEIVQKHYRKLTFEDKKEIFARLESEIKRDHNISANISDPQPMDGVEFAYILNVGRCIGCRKALAYDSGAWFFKFSRIPSYLGCDCFKRLSDFESLGLFLCPVQRV